MTPDEILEIDAKKNKPKGTTAGQSRFRINRWFESGGQLVQDNKTLFLFVSNGKGEVEVHTYTADNPEGYANSLGVFARLMKGVGAKELVTAFSNRPKLQQFLQGLADKLGIPCDIQDYGTHTFLRAYLQD